MTAGIFSDLSGQRFSAVCADPPWNFREYVKSGNDPKSRHASRHYATMDIDAIKALPVADLCAKDCHLFLWATAPNLLEAIDTMQAWGFRYSTMAFVWVKQKRSFQPDQFRFAPGSESDLHVGLGHTTRKNAEYVLLGRRGSPKRLAKNIREIILAPVRQHSRKPDEAYSRIQRYCDGPYVELFARESREGWATWGNERSKFDPNPASAGAADIPTQGER